MAHLAGQSQERRVVRLARRSRRRPPLARGLENPRPERGEPVVLLHSAEAARHFAAEVDRLGLSRGRIALAAFAPRIAAAAGTGWAASRAARQPNDPALLALAREMCHEPFPGRDGRQ